MVRVGRVPSEEPWRDYYLIRTKTAKCESDKQSSRCEVLIDSGGMSLHDSRGRNRMTG